MKKKRLNFYGIQLNFCNFLKKFPEDKYLKDYWTEILEYSKKEENHLIISTTTNVNKELPTIILAKRMFHNTVRIRYVLKELEYNLSRYGDRRKKQAFAGCEFKGLYHAMRLIFEAEELLTTGSLNFPFSKEKHDFLKSIKDGTIDPEVLFKSIDDGIENLQILEKKTVSNKKSVCHLIDKLIWKYYGELEIKSIRSIYG